MENHFIAGFPLHVSAGLAIISKSKSLCLTGDQHIGNDPGGTLPKMEFIASFSYAFDLLLSVVFAH